MGKVNVNLLKARLVERGMNFADLAKLMGINRSTLYRKLKNGGKNLLIGEANAIVQGLGLSAQDAMLIFFSEQVA